MSNIPIRRPVPDETLDEYLGRGLNLARDYHGRAMALGQWFEEGKKWSRERTALIQSPDWSGPELLTIHNYARVYRKFKTSGARDAFPMRHLDAVSALPLAQAEEVLREGRRRGWKSYDLRFEAQRLRDVQKVFAHDPGFTLADLIAQGEKFRTIYADVPWQPKHPVIRWRVEHHYKTMSLDELCELPIKELIYPDAHLHFWTPMSYLDLSFRVIDAWGFRYAGSGLVWLKDGHLGAGNFWRENHEVMLLGVGPKAKRFSDRTLRSYVEANRSKVHSEKPAIIRDLIERASPPPRLELFGRHEVKGWTVWGDQIIREVADDGGRPLG